MQVIDYTMAKIKLGEVEAIQCGFLVDEFR
jgi:hypothetical protein